MKKNKWNDNLFLRKWGDEIEHPYVQKALKNRNLLILKMYSLITGVLIFFMLILSFVLKDFGNISTLYLCTFLMLMGIRVTTEVFVKERTGYLMFMAGLFLLTMDIFGIAIACVFHPNELTVSFVAILLLQPTIFADHKYRVQVVSILAMIIFSVLAFMCKPHSTFTLDMVDVWMFGLLGILSGMYTSNVTIDKYLVEYRILVMSENDELTGIKNRNCYEKRLSGYFSECRETLCCLYADANGLHELNNQYGHKAGDNMLKSVADNMKHMAGPEDTYRIGGDEFIAFFRDMDEGRLLEMIEEFKAELEKEGYHASLGYAFQTVEEADITELVKSAERLMYADKADFYTKTGKDRRGRFLVEFQDEEESE